MPDTPNTLAYIALIIWPLVSLLFYKRLPVVHATFWTIVGGFLILPVGLSIDAPLIPPLGKNSIPIISAVIGCVYIKKIKITLLPRGGIERWLVLVFLCVPVVTMLNNQEPINNLPGLTFHDAFSSTINLYLYLLPFILGMQLIKTEEDQLVLFKLLVVSALIYSPFILFEIRMSPQLHTWIYGYFPHNFGQQMRFGGFRAVVFLGHGLIVSMYLAVALGAAAILIRKKVKIRGIPPEAIALFFIALLILNKTVSGFILGIILFISIVWLSNKMIRRLSMFFIVIVLLYPELVMVDLFPHQQLVQLAYDFNPERGQSLEFRFFNENLLVEHGQNKLFFGWGGWGRHLPEGLVKDAFWLTIFGIYGLIGFLSLFGLIFLSVMRATKSSSFLSDKKNQRLLLSHSLIISIIMIDQLPNSSLDDAWLIFLIGAILGRANTIISGNKLTRNKALLS